jgi:hypothetical protein
MKAKKIINIWKPIKNDISMKTIKILILILTIFIASETKAQYFSDTIHIIPQFPTINDTIFLVNIFVNPNGGSSLDSSFINYYPSDIFVDFFYAAYITYFPAIDTINIGTLPAGDYELFLNMYLCASIGCVSWDTLYRNIEFTVTEVNSLFEINNIYDKPIKVYPNPALNQINIKYPNDLIISSIKLYAITGRLIKTFPKEEKQLNISGLPAGLYILYVEANGKIFREKIIIDNLKK